MNGRLFFMIWLVPSILLLGCARPIVPESMEPLIDRTVSFQDLLASPESYQGRVLVLGGEVLKAKRLRDSTQLEVLQLPLDKRGGTTCRSSTITGEISSLAAGIS